MTSGGWQNEIIYDYLQLALNDTELVDILMPDVTMKIYKDFSTTIISDFELMKQGKFKPHQNCLNCGTERQPRKDLFDHIFKPVLTQEEEEEEHLTHHTIGASNNWAIHGNLTKNGKPIIANDPHLGNSMPSNWHVSHIRLTEGGKVQELWGAYFPGAPVPIIGGNMDITYSMTVLPADVSDLYEEKVEGDKYLFKGQWLPLKYRREVIKIKGQEPLVITV